MMRGFNDGGFDFRTTDDPAREFIWSQAEWIEATPVRYGTHAARLAVVVADVIDQLRRQNGTTWQYIAGTMWGTMSPDQRPTDLGTHDAGFDFRSTDAPPRRHLEPDRVDRNNSGGAQCRSVCGPHCQHYADDG